MAAPIRVLVVDDSALVRQILTRALSRDPHIEIVGTARNGVEALEKAGDLSPDVITLDLEMPELDGVQVLRHLHRRSDARVVVLTSVDDAGSAYAALSLGAVDFVQKPAAGIATSINELAAEMRIKIRTAFHITPEHAAGVALSRRSAQHASPQDEREAPSAHTRFGDRLSVCVGLAASTGGPPALETVFSSLSADLGAAFVVVQHLPAGFSASLGRRLSAHTDIPFSRAVEGMVLEPGHGYVAPHGSHLTVITDLEGTRRFKLARGAPVHGVCPSADPLFASLAEQFGGNAIAVVLTGMGTDGAVGCSAIARAGGEVVVQDEETSIVWGMPRAVVRAGLTNRAYPIGSVAEEIRRAIHERAGEAEI